MKDTNTTSDRLRRIFYEDESMLHNTVERIHEMHGEVIEKIGFEPRFVIQQKAERFIPRFDLFEDDDCYQVFLELPGLSAEEIRLSLTSGALKVSGTRVNEKSDGKIRFMEQLQGHFIRVLHLDEPVEPGGSQAVLSRGVLRISLPKAPVTGTEAAEHRIRIVEE